MKRFVILLLTAVLALTMPLSALAAGQIEVTEDISVSDDYDWTRFKGQNVTLNVYNWGEYISNGSDDSVDVVAAFEKLTGIKVNYTTFDSNESLYAKLKSGAANYDVIIPSDYMVAKMISEGMLMPLDYSNIPNFQNIDEEYRNGDYDPENAYTVPYTLCTTGIIYNTKMVDEAPTSWADLWDEKYAGNILMFNNSRDAYAIGAFKSGSSVNPQTTEEVDAVVDELKAQKPLVQAYVMDEIFDKMIGSEAAVGVYYSGDAITMIDDNPDLAWVFPEEGTVLSVDSMAIPATSEHEEAAEMFINFMCEPDVGKANIEYIGYTTPMHCVWDILDEDLKYSEIAYPSEDIAVKEEVFTALSEEVNSELDVKWSEMKSYDEGGSGYLFLMLLAAMLALACFNIWRKVRRKTRNMYLNLRGLCGGVQPLFIRKGKEYERIQKLYGADDRTGRRQRLPPLPEAQRSVPVCGAGVGRPCPGLRHGPRLFQGAPQRIPRGQAGPQGLADARPCGEDQPDHGLRGVQERHDETADYHHQRNRGEAGPRGLPLDDRGH